MSGALCKRWSALGCLVVLVMSAAMVREARAQTGDDLYSVHADGRSFIVAMTICL
jgi:hypothetical protein